MTVDRTPLEDVWRRAIDAHVTYYRTLGELSADYVRAVAGVLQDVDVPRLRLNELLGRPVGRASRSASESATPTTRRPTTRRPTSTASAPAPPSAAPAIVLEAPAGGTAVGVFLVENVYDREVSATVEASTFTAEDGTAIRPRLAFEPAVVTLGPNEQVLVRVAATIGDEVVAGRDYRGNLSVPGLTGTQVPVVVRRRADSDEVPDGTPGTAPPDELPDGELGGPRADPSAGSEPDDGRSEP